MKTATQAGAAEAPAAAGPLLPLRGVAKNFGPVQALQDVDFEVHAGEVVALVSNISAGKSTIDRRSGILEDLGSAFSGGSWCPRRDSNPVEVAGVTAFELANAAPAVVENRLTRHLAWRGHLTGGLLMLDERLGALLSDRSLSAFYADPRLEAFVPAEGEVVVLVQLRHPIRIDRADWAARVTAADDGRGLAALSWRVSQWQWVPEDTQDKGADDQGIGGEWALHPHSPIDAAAVFERLPEPLILWVHRWTEQAVDLFDELEADEPRSLPPPAG